jgi:hypothetical protein
LCKSLYQACSANSDCTAYESCLAACAQGDTVCEDNCATAHPTGSALYLNFSSCVCSNACTTQCATECN